MITPRDGNVRPSGAAARPAKAASWAAALAFVAALVCLAPAATAYDKHWAVGSGQWDVSGNWNPSGQPQAGDGVYLTQSDATDRTVEYYNTTNPDAVLNSLTIDATGAGTMTLDMPNDHALSVSSEYVGFNGQGAVTQSAGTHTTGTLYLGYNTAGDGTYTLTGGTLSSLGRQYVGYYGTGALNIEAGGQVSNYWGGYLGHWSGSSGTATVTGAGSTWTNSYVLYVGYYGAGTLNIEAGGLVSNTYGYLGYSSGSTGTATVTGAGSTWTNSSDLYVGYWGTGTLTVADGGLVSAGTLYASMGDLFGNGTMTAQGAVLDADLVFDSTHGLVQAMAFGTGGTLNLNVDGTGGLGVGYKGTGTLRIAQGRTVASTLGYLGHRSGSTGTATVTGAGSTWTTSWDLYVGYQGTGMLNIEAGGQVSSYWECYLGYSSGSTGTATVTGSGSTWTNSSALCVGYEEGTGTLKIEAGGQVSSSAGFLGRGSGSTGRATVTGAGSTWTNSGGLYVGYGGAGTLNIEAGGQVSSSAGCLGLFSGSTDTATVTGAGSTWTNSGDLWVGGCGAGTLNIEAGGQVSGSYGYLGYSSGSTGTATVTGAGSTWTNSSGLYVGYDGAGTLTVADGGLVTAQTLYASMGDLFGNGTMTAQGAVLDADLVFDGTHGLAQGLAFGVGGTLNLNVDGTGGLGAGYKGTGTLRIAQGRTVACTSGYLGYSSGSTGIATVTGAGSTWTNSSGLYVGWYGAGTLNIEAGGHVSSTGGYLGFGAGSTGIVTVDGAGSTWTHSDYLTIGSSGSGILNIRNGGAVTNYDATWVGSSGEIHFESNGVLTTWSLFASPSHLTGTGTINARGLVSDVDLVFDSTASLNQTFTLSSYPGQNITVNLDMASSGYPGRGYLGAGYQGHGSLAIRNGVTVNSQSGYIGYDSGATGVATVEGTGSTWNNLSLVVGGFLGSGTGVLNIVNGGTVNTTGFGTQVIGDCGAGEMTVDGPGSSWANKSQLIVGNFSNGELRITGGGTVSNTVCWIGDKAGSTGEVLLDGAGSTWTNSSALYVGYGGTGTLTIQNGGEVSNGNGYLGSSSGGADTVTVDGPGSTWTNSGDLYFGWNGTGTLNIRNGGLVAVGGILELWQPDSSVTVNAGTLIAGTLEGQTGTIRITDPAGGTALTVGSAGAGTFSGALLDDTGPGSLTKIGTGTQVLAGGGIIYTGTTTVLDGILKLSDTTAFASDILSGATTEFEVTTDTWTFDEAIGGAGTFVKSGGGTLVIAGPQDYDPGALWDVLAGTMVLNTDAGSLGADLSISVTGAELRFGCDQHLDTLTIGDDGLVVFAGANCVVLKHLVFNGLDLGATTLTPEPATFSLLALGGLALLCRRRAA